MKHPQPAQLSYFFHGGFIDLTEVIATAFKHCGEIISRSAEGISDAWGNLTDKFLDGFWSGILNLPFFIGKFSFYLVRLISTAVITPFICFSITLFQIALLLALFSIALLFFGIIILIDRIYCIFNAIATHCPVCQSKFSLPVYVCSCGREHDRLRPGIYGILYRRCNCGKKLPTTFFNGRQKLTALCPDCKNNIKDGGLHASWCIPVVGGPSSGKTCYINMTMMLLEKCALSKYGLRFEYENNGLDEYKDNSDRLSRGYLPEKTQELRLRYYQFNLTPKGATKQQISLCDVAGELFDINTGGLEIKKQIGFRYANAFMLVIDPLSIPDYRAEVSKTTNLNGYKVSVQPIDEMVDAFINTLQNMFSIKADDLLNSYVAVIFTKADIPGLDEKIGESAVLKNASNLDLKARYKTQNELCEKFLRGYNEGSFLNHLKSRFKGIQFFTCSALGHIENGKPFESYKVEEPFFWLMRKKSKVIDRAIKKGGSIK
jgi:hypothetical protein